VRYLEQRGVLRADLDVAELPANRRDLAFVGCEPRITLHRDAFLAEPQRADRATLFHMPTISTPYGGPAYAERRRPAQAVGA
jgi:hypothetical protein